MADDETLRTHTIKKYGWIPDLPDMRPGVG